MTRTFFRPISLGILLDSGWAVVILDKYGQEVTSFVKNKMKNLDQVLRYMVNAGYNLVH